MNHSQTVPLSEAPVCKHGVSLSTRTEKILVLKHGMREGNGGSEFADKHQCKFAWHQVRSAVMFCSVGSFSASYINHKRPKLLYIRGPPDDHDDEVHMSPPAVATPACRERSRGSVSTQPLVSVCRTIGTVQCLIGARVIGMTSYISMVSVTWMPYT